MPKRLPGMFSRDVHEVDIGSRLKQGLLEAECSMRGLIGLLRMFYFMANLFGGSEIFGADAHTVFPRTSGLTTA